jgi:hypothetical protein
MAALLLSVTRFLRLLLSGHQAVALENAALGLQLAAFQRKRRRPVLTTVDRLFWIALRCLWSGWRGPLLYVQPDTVVRWQRERFRQFWARLSKPHRRPRGRPATGSEIRRLIEGMVSANPLWRAPRIHGELTMCDPERQASETDLDIVFPLLPWVQNPSGSRQTMSASASRVKNRENGENPTSR